MRSLFKNFVTALLCLTGCTPAIKQGEVKHWAVYYDSVLPASRFSRYDLVVFDRRHHPDFSVLKGKTQVLAYVSIGEVYDDVPEKKLLEAKKAILFQNDKWSSHAVDLTSPEWRRLVLGYVDDAVKKGFDGVMLDTVDSPLHWAETKQPDQYDRMKEGAADLIHAIRTAHPKLKIMLNRGFSILPMVAGDIHYALAESILTTHDDFTGQFALFPPNTYVQTAAQLHQAVAVSPQLQVLTLDYWNIDDVKGLERIYARHRGEGFAPYVTTPDLTTFTPEPKHR